MKYAQIEERLHEGSPVRWAVSESLRQAQSHLPNLEIASQPNLRFIYGPLRDLFRNQHQDLARTLTRLAVLEARFQREYLQQEEIDWAQRFNTNTRLFDRLTTTSSQELADSLIKKDTFAFQTLCPLNIVREDSRLRVIHRRWDRLCRAIQESLTVNNGLRPLLADLAEELHIRHNYYSLCAVLQALRKKSFDESQLPHLFILINHDRNYASYRNVHKVAPCLPFLPPHIRQLGHDKEKALGEIYSFLMYKSVRAQRQELGRKEQEIVGKKLLWSACIWSTTKGGFSCLAARRVSERGAACHALILSNGQKER